MKTKSKFTNYILPRHFASALINDDESGLSDSDIDKLNQWLAKIQPGTCVKVSDNHWFSYNNAIDNLCGDVCEYTFIIHY
jgi:hypothetical protein